MYYLIQEDNMLEEKFFTHLKEECIKNKIDILTVYKIIQIIKDYFKK